MRGRLSCLLALALALPTNLFADFQYTETTKITGGSMMSMMKLAARFSKQARQQIDAPVVTSVYVSGNRMARNDPDSSEIIDLDNETVTHIDHQKKQYYTITFQQMREQLLEAQRLAAQQPPPSAPQQPKPDMANDPQLSFDVAVRNTGANKQFSGVDTTEAILALTLHATDQQTGKSGSLAMTSDLWLTPEIPGYQELRDFQVRYAKKLGDIYGSAISSMMKSLPQQPQANMPVGSTQGFKELAEEASKLKGVPIYTVTRMGTTLDGKPLPAASEAPLPDADQNANANANTPSAGDVAKLGAANSASSAIAGKLGGFGSMLGGFGHKKQNNPPPPAAPENATPQPPPENMVLMETTTELGGFSSASIDTSHFQPPPGYQQVPIPNLHPRQLATQ